MNRLGIETLSVFGLPPVEFVTLAADLGCAHISMGLTQVPINPHGYPGFSLREDVALRHEMVAAMRDRGVSIALGEGVNVRPGADIRSLAPELDIMAALGVPRINTVSLDPDIGRSLDQFAVLAEMAAARGMTTTTEFAPGLTIADLSSAIAAIRHVGRRDFRLLIDTMHFFRTGGVPAELAALDPDMIGYIQIADAPLQPRFESYMQEAMTERLAPGMGEAPLREILAALPRELVVSLEIPLLSEAQSGIGPYERLRPCVDTVRALLAELDA
ncbi:sugar phosphate isomerase/epimerase [Acidocella sp.]|uniref:sugar phosphate isomerase/epimerase family protein n=1 Tax=Acidocella sp. TaxID=50710 RepID=UPI00261D1D0E|nr:sugar phosphate isomerase/epimerase [Acidocella sp.]